MKKFIKPLVLLCAIAVTTGAYAQQDKPARPIKDQLKMKHAAAAYVKRINHKSKAEVVPNRQADIDRIIRQQGITVLHVK